MKQHQQMQQQMQQLQEVQEQMHQVQEQMRQGWESVVSLQDRTKQLEEKQWRLQYKVDEVKMDQRSMHMNLLGHHQRAEEVAEERYREMSELLGSHVTACQAASAAAATIEQVQQQLQQQHEWQQQCIVYLQTQVAVANHTQEVERAAILQLQSDVLRCRKLPEAAAAAAAERQGQRLAPS